jgi:hypothetical protein
MENPPLEIYLSENNPMLLPHWDGKPRLRMEYVYSDTTRIATGTNYFRNLEDIKEISEGIVRQINEIPIRGYSKIIFRKGKGIFPPIDRMLNELKYQEIITYLRTEHPEITLETEE